jgi:DNA-binding Lrp family transcriptional regulator
MSLLDKKDWQILEILCENARFSHNQIAKKVKLSKNAVSYRINRLQKKKIISGFFSIIDQSLFGISFFEVLIKINASNKDSEEFIEYLKQNPNVLVVDKLSGEWSFVIEIGCKSQNKFYSILSEINNKFSDIIETYEVHPILSSYKVEQLPVELVKPKEIRPFKGVQGEVKVDEMDKKLLNILDKDSTLPLHEIADKLGVTYETVAARIKKLKEKGIILRFTAKIFLPVLGYEIYLLIIDFRNLSKEAEAKLREYLINNKNIRYAFMSAAKPELFIYFASKNNDELDNFMNSLKENFPEEIVNQKYLITRFQHKYDLFPEGLI